MSDPIPLRLRPSTKAIRTTASSGRAMVRAITFDAFGTLIDTGRDVLIRIARSVCDDQRPSLDAEALLATWDRHFFAAETAPFLTLAEITEDSLAKTFREYAIDASPAPYVDRLLALWRGGENSRANPPGPRPTPCLPPRRRSHDRHHMPTAL